MTPTPPNPRAAHGRVRRLARVAPDRPSHGSWLRSTVDNSAAKVRVTGEAVSAPYRGHGTGSRSNASNDRRNLGGAGSRDHGLGAARPPGSVRIHSHVHRGAHRSAPNHVA